PYHSHDDRWRQPLIESTGKGRHRAGWTWADPDRTGILRADRIRAQLLSEGITLIDRPDGATPLAAHPTGTSQPSH
ncbi:MAG: hypothetical protein OXG70_02870, partial [Cyanobacteria bacterium MAG IRC1_bin_28]|nr:hypothetical protein [Cyanobacteria bacterium MAG IRC1_bin_28]